MKLSDYAQKYAHLKGKPLRFQNQQWLADIYKRSLAGTVVFKTARASQKSQTLPVQMPEDGQPSFESLYVLPEGASK